VTDRVHVLTLGGTISMTCNGDGGLEPALDARALLDVPGLADVTQLESTSFSQVPGAHLRLGDLARLGRQAAELLSGGRSGLVIT
jgi:L-asparaginase